MSILVIKHGALGDFFQSLPLFQAIRLHHAQESVTLLTTPPFEVFARELGLFDCVLTDPREGVPWSFFKETWHAAYAIVYDLQLSTRTRWYCHALRHILPKKSAIYGEQYALPATAHSFARRQEVLKKAGFSVQNLKTTFPPSSCEPFQNLLPKDHPFALFVIGASASFKIWPVEGFIAVGKWCVTQGMCPVLTGGIAEQSLARAFLKAVPAAIDLTGKTHPMDILKLGAKACIAIGNDTGPMHGIAVVGCPSVVIFSPYTSPQLSAPLGRVRTLQGTLSEISSSEVIAALKLVKIK
ncbi:MAG: glycosyltransferase family 9 protein [Holosporales bacterium]|jgi:ADP-heptose:LPS heptosyltransferase|nr:glycosyltransferase family 9 protein [Holosporales bacterium]